MAERLHPSPHRVYVPLDYPTSAVNWPRWGHGRAPHRKLAELISRHDDRYREHLEILPRYKSELATIGLNESDPHEPFWNNGWLPGLDAASLYCFLRALTPARYLEIGSGHSTKFAARAKRDEQLATEIISIDPHPQAQIDALCDRVVREPLEQVDLAIFDQLSAGDVVFFDGSHRTFMNSDVTVFFLDVLPNLASGVLVGVHDIGLPEDYSPEFRERYYSEQYLLAAYLLADGSLLEPVLPCAYVSEHRELSQVLAPLWSDPRFEGVETHGGAFWLRLLGRHDRA